MEVHELAEIFEKRMNKQDKLLEKVIDQTNLNTTNIALNKQKSKLSTGILGTLQVILTSSILILRK